MAKSNLSAVAKKFWAATKKHSPEILTGLGIAGMITTTVMAVRATPKALMLIEEKKVDEYRDELTPIETVKVAWKCYIPSAIVGTVSVGCLIGASSANLRRNAALATAYALSESTLKEYQEKVIEEVGEKKEQKVRDAVAKDKLDKVYESNVPIIRTEKGGNTLCLDGTSKRLFYSDMETIKKAVNELNRQMLINDYISLNQFYAEIGLDETDIGDDLGWDISRGYIEPDFRSQLTKDGEPCLVIGFHVGPRWDYLR